MKSPDPNSKRSKKRKNRGFNGVSSTRKHKRSERRQSVSRFFDGKDHKPGEKGEGPTKFEYTAGGSNKYH